MERRGIQAIALAIFGFVLMVTNPRFSFIDDEVNVVVTATHPVSNTIALFTSGAGQHEHPPLADILLHYWLWLTNSNLAWLRLYGVGFFLAGLWMLAETAYALTQRSHAACLVLALGILWPYGFHFGRLAIWYSLSFFLVALLTYERVKLEPDWKICHIAGFALVALALVYTNYFGWALVACLVLDLVISRRVPKRAVVAVVTIVLLLIVAYIPMIWAFIHALENRLPVAGHSAWGRMLYAGYSLYAVFVSESVAPWIWPLSIPAALAIAYSTVCVLGRGPALSRRLFIYFLGLMLLMSVMGILNTKRLLLIACWMLLPLALTLEKPQPKARWLAVALIVIGVIGWSGIITRRFYAAPHFVEPWRQVAEEAARIVRNGGAVISNSEPFFELLLESSAGDF
jgi:hypothetical protein